MKSKLTKEDFQDLNTLTDEQNLEMQKKFNEVLKEELSKPENQLLREMKSENENLESSQTVIIGNWVAVSERLPEIPKDGPSYAQEVKVIACWGDRIENTAEMRYCRRKVRGKEVYRFEWMGKISPWKVNYWMEFPKPPNYHKTIE